MIPTRRTWPPIIAEAARLAASFTTAVTVRQVHYLLTTTGFGGYRNTDNDYKRLSKLSAEARRLGTFPALSDTTRGVHRPLSFTGPDDAIAWVADHYRRDRTENQPVQVWMLFEKATLGAQIRDWTDPYAIPSAALRGYSSESLEREIFEEMVADGRPVIAFYLGDLDPEGLDIERNFRAQADRQGIIFKEWRRLAVTEPQVALYGLVPMPAKPKSSRAKAFTARHGSLFQIEVEAVNPGILQALVTDAITDPAVFDVDAFDNSRTLEADESDTLIDLADTWTP